MSAGDYAKAYKAGARDYKYRISRGEYPYLPVLEEIVSHVDIEGQVPLGLVEIPIKSIVGISTHFPSVYLFAGLPYLSGAVVKKRVFPAISLYSPIGRLRTSLSSFPLNRQMTFTCLSKSSSHSLWSLRMSRYIPNGSLL